MKKEAIIGTVVLLAALTIAAIIVGRRSNNSHDSNSPTPMSVEERQEWLAARQAVATMSTDCSTTEEEEGGVLTRTTVCTVDGVTGTTISVRGLDGVWETPRCDFAHEVPRRPPPIDPIPLSADCSPGPGCIIPPDTEHDGYLCLASKHSAIFTLDPDNCLEQGLGEARFLVGVHTHNVVINKIKDGMWDGSDDGDCDEADYPIMVDCFTGPLPRPDEICPGMCECQYDYNRDGDIDLEDFARFSQAFRTGTTYWFNNWTPDG